MEKTKLGISVGLMGALMFLICLLGGYVSAIVAAGYILLCEKDQWLKKTTIKALVLMIGFGLMLVLIGLIPETFNFIQSVAELFNGYLDVSVLYQFFNMISLLVGLVKKVVFVLLAWKALKMQTINVPVVDSLLKKYTEE